MAPMIFQMVHPVQNPVIEWEWFVVILITIHYAELALGCMWYDVIVFAVSAEYM